VCSLGSRFLLFLLLFNCLSPLIVLVALSFCGLRLIDKLVTSEGIIGLTNSLLKCMLDF
jgi:hypothetical protein